MNVRTLRWLFLMCLITIGTFSSVCGFALNLADTRIAFMSNRTGNSEIFSMKADGSDVVNLTNHSAFDIQPAWSPNGMEIAFASNRHDTSQTEIYVMDSEGGNIRRLTVNLGDADNHPTWSPDGSKIAFQSRRGAGAFDIFVMNAFDGSNVTRLTTHPSDDEEPDWSPWLLGGSKIAFRSMRNGASFTMAEIYVMNAVDGSSQQRLTDLPGWDGSPDWSPNGLEIAYTSARTFPLSSSGPNDTSVMNADGTNPHQVFPAPNDSPSWSPDGAYIAVRSFRTGNAEIYIKNLITEVETNLTNAPSSEDSFPSWSPFPVSQDTTPPTIVLNGDNPLILECPEPYVELGAIVTDDQDPNPTLDIAGTVNSHAPGTYLIAYTAQDISGNVSDPVTRTVIVQDATPSTITASLTPGANPGGNTPKGNNDGFLLVSYSATDTCDPSPNVSGTVCGIPVANGETIKYTQAKGRNTPKLVLNGGRKHILCADPPELVVTATDASGNTASIVVEVTPVLAVASIPANFSLGQNFPNPFNPETWIPYQLREGSEVTIAVYDAGGRAIRRLQLGYQPAGVYRTRDRSAYWDGRNDAGEQVASGVYFYELRAGTYRAMRRFVVSK